MTVLNKCGKTAAHAAVSHVIGEHDRWIVSALAEQHKQKSSKLKVQDLRFEKTKQKTTTTTTTKTHQRN